MFGHNSRVRLNDAHGNGYADPADDFGIGVLASASGNIIEENSVTGNTQGIFIGPATRDTLIRANMVIGNPAIQVGISHREARTADIVNLAPEGQTTFERNVCVSGVNAPCPIVTRPPQ